MIHCRGTARPGWTCLAAVDIDVQRLPDKIIFPLLGCRSNPGVATRDKRCSLRDSAWSPSSGSECSTSVAATGWDSGMSCLAALIVIATTISWTALCGP